MAEVEENIIEELQEIKKLLYQINENISGWTNWPYLEEIRRIDLD